MRRNSRYTRSVRRSRAALSPLLQALNKVVISTEDRMPARLPAGRKNISKRGRFRGPIPIVQAEKIMHTHTALSRTALAATVYAALLPQLGVPQVAPPAILQIDLADYTLYREDVSDPVRYATDPNPVGVAAFGPVRNFYRAVHLADIVAVNGQQVKGNFAASQVVVGFRTEPTPGLAIGDAYRNTIAAITLEILKSNGTPIGTIVANGLGSGTPPPGSPVPASTVLQGGHNLAITGGTGAFLGARGQIGSLPPVARNTSFTEDPANRRRNGGGAGTWRWIAHVIPMSAPQILTTASGPAIFHEDFSPVTSARPARPGEILIVQATGLGPTRPSVDPGQPFPTDASLPVNSPLAVTVNGQNAEIVNGFGWPGLVDTYRVDFRVPDGLAAGTASVQLNAAWIAGSPVQIAVQ
jgi:uncharacterized protein (TIGR03437 family)